MLRSSLIVAALAAAIIAALMPSMRDLVAVAMIGGILIIGAASFGNHERAAARQAYVLALHTRSEIAKHL